MSELILYAGMQKSPKRKRREKESGVASTPNKVGKVHIVLSYFNSSKKKENEEKCKKISSEKNENTLMLAASLPVVHNTKAIEQNLLLT